MSPVWPDDQLPSTFPSELVSGPTRLNLSMVLNRILSKDTGELLLLLNPKIVVSSASFRVV